MEFVDYHEIHLKNSKKIYAKTVGFYRPKSERVSESFVSLCNSRVRKWKKRKRIRLQNVAFLRSAKKKVPEPEEYIQLSKSDKKNDMGRKQRFRKLPEPEEYLQFRAIKFRSKRGSELLATVLTNIDRFSKLLIFH